MTMYRGGCNGCLCLTDCETGDRRRQWVLGSAMLLLDAPEDERDAGALFCVDLSLCRWCCCLSSLSPLRLLQRGRGLAAACRASWWQVDLYFLALLLSPVDFAAPMPLPQGYFFHCKLATWSALMHLAFYLLSVYDGIVAWTEPTWLLKAVLAAWSLLYHTPRRVSLLRRRWPFARLGALDPPLTLGGWSSLAAFKWDAPADLWALAWPLAAARPGPAQRGLSSAGSAQPPVQQLLA